MTDPQRHPSRRPFRAEHLRAADPYERSNQPP